MGRGGGGLVLPRSNVTTFSKCKSGTHAGVPPPLWPHLLLLLFPLRPSPLARGQARGQSWGMVKAAQGPQAAVGHHRTLHLPWAGAQGGQEQLPACVPTLQSTLPRAGGGLGTLGLPTAARVPGQPLTTSAPPTPIRKRLVPPVSVGQVWRGAAGNLGQMQPQSRSARDQDLKCTFLGLSHPIRNRWSPYLGVERAGQISGLRVISDLGSG